MDDAHKKHNLYELSRKNNLEEIIKLKNFKEKVELILKIIDDSNLIIKERIMSKDEIIFNKFYTEAKTIYKDANDNKTLIATLKLFTKSIAFAPHPSVKLALAYANRSIILFRLNLYLECLEDIERALALNYPDQLKAKILLRKAKCQIILKRRPDAKITLKEAQKWIKETRNLSYEQKINFLRLQYVQLKKKYAHIEQSADDSTEVKESSVIANFNNEVPYASDAVTIEYNEDYGRHVIATRDIEPGEVIAVEKPYTLLLKQSEKFTHCSNCLKVCWANIPCKHCAYAMYCSKKCRDDEWKKCHNVECDVFPALIENNCDDMDLLSLRLAVLALKEAEGDMEKLKKMVKRLDECYDPRTSNFFQDGKLHSDKYAGIYNLSIPTNMYEYVSEEVHMLRTCIIIYFLATRTEIFGTKLSNLVDTSDLVENDNVIFFGGLIFKHLGIIHQNPSPFSEAYGNKFNYYCETVMSFGTLINHSCNPNVLIQSRPEHLAIVAIYPIQKDEQLFVDYGPIFYNISKKARQEELENIFSLKCNCVACEKEWPTLNSDKLQSYMTLVKPEERAKIKEALQKFNKYRNLVKKGNVDDELYLIEKLSKMVRELHNHAPLPCLETTRVFKLLYKAYMITGNRFKLPQKQEN